MNKDDIKKALECCCNSDFKTACRNCPYLTRPRCNDTLCKDALNLITEQEKEIERLKAECEKVYAVRNDLLKENDELIKTNAELLLLPKQAVKQAKIDVLNELKQQMDNERYNDDTADIIRDIVDELIKEIEK